MKLSSAQVQQVLGQIEGQALSDDHPTLPQLEGIFGPHTFFVDAEGLHVVERPEVTNSGRQDALVVKVASWADEEMTSLTPHDAEFAGTVALGADDDEGPDPAA